MLLSCLRTYLWVNRSSRLHGPPCLSTDSLCLCIMVSTETPTYNKDKTTKPKILWDIRGKHSMCSFSLLILRAWHDNPFLSTCLSWFYMISATDGSEIKRFTIPLGIWSTSIFLFWNTSSSTGPYYATFPVIIRAKRTPISKIQMDHSSHGNNGH